MLVARITLSRCPVASIRPTTYSVANCAASLTTASKQHHRGMSSEKQEITAWASKDDGSFKRQVSSFRDAIEEGGKFSPEKGEWASSHALELLTTQADTTSMSAWRALGLIVP
jgi:hypothetical protein